MSMAAGWSGIATARDRQTLPDWICGNYQPRWEGAYAGYDVMMDLGIFLGEYLIAKRPRLHGEIYRGHPVEPAKFKSTA